MHQVQLAVYDLSNGMAAQLSLPLIGTRVDGIWHTGVVMFGYEYFFGGGIQKLRAGLFAQSHGMSPVQMLDMGNTTKTQAEVDEFIRSIRHRFTQSTYDLIRHNCNNFSNELVQFVLHRDIPHHILHLAENVFSTPGGAMIRPLIENMQNRVNNGNRGMDPFGGEVASSAPFDPLGTPVSAAAAASVPRPSGPARPLTYHRIEFSAPLHSTNCGAELLTRIGDKLLAAGAVAAGQIGWSEDQAKCLKKTVQHFTGREPADPASLSGIYAVLHHALLNFSPASCQVPCLFMLRLAVLCVPSYGALSTESESEMNYLMMLVENLLSRLKLFDLDPQAAASVPGTEPPFASVGAYVLALCVLSNVVATCAGASDESPEERTLRLSSGVPGFMCSASVCEQMLECVFRSLSVGATSAHFVDLQMAASALLFNLAVLWTRQGMHEQYWCAVAGPGAEEVHPAAVQVVCGLLEDSTVTDADLKAPLVTARLRKLSVLCMIVRAHCAAPGSTGSLKPQTPGLTEQLRDLVIDLGYVERLKAFEEVLVSRMGGTEAGDATEEISLVHEICEAWVVP